MKIALDTTVKRPAAVLKALRSGKTLKLKYKDDEVEVVVVAHPPQESELERIMRHPAFGMWADREDMKDSAAYVRNLRRPRYVQDGSGTRDKTRESAR